MIHIVYLSSKKLLIVPKINWEDDLCVQTHKEGGRNVPFAGDFFQSLCDTVCLTRRGSLSLGLPAGRLTHRRGVLDCGLKIWCCSEWQTGLYRQSQSRRCVVDPLLERCWLSQLVDFKATFQSTKCVELIATGF